MRKEYVVYYYNHNSHESRLSVSEVRKAFPQNVVLIPVPVEPKEVRIEVLWFDNKDEPKEDNKVYPLDTK